MDTIMTITPEIVTAVLDERDFLALCGQAKSSPDVRLSTPAQPARTWHSELAPHEERDALAEQLGQCFEELHWLRRLSTTLSKAGPTTDLTAVARAVLPHLRALLRAEAIVLTPPVSAALEQNRLLDVVDGQLPVSERHFVDLCLQMEYADAQLPIVFNRDSELQFVPLDTAARNVVAARLNHGDHRYGWLIALNRIITLDTVSLTDVSSPEFGTYEHGLLTTAAGMLAGHARNVELFRSEEQLRVNVIEALAEALDARDPYTCGHSRRVGKYAAQIAQRRGCTPDVCERLYVTGLLHDVGKIGIPDEILKKADKLTDDEFAVIQQHPTIGHTILSPIKRLAFVLPGVLHHHERVDGRGYPHRLAGDAIPLDARMLAVADSYDAMTSSRAYRHAMSAERALSILRDGAGTQWDAELVAAWCEICQSPGSSPAH